MGDLIYGRNAVYESLRAGRRAFVRLRIAASARSANTLNDIISLAQSANIPIERVARHELDELGEVNHQGVILEAGPYPYTPLEVLLDEIRQQDHPPLLLILDLLQDPQNVGTLLRTAEAVGVNGVVIQHRRAADITPSVVNTSSGAVEHLKIAQVANISQAIAALKEHGLWVFGLEATQQAQSYASVDLTGPMALVVGSEGSGLRRLVRDNCDLLIELPMSGRINSLNAAVAGSVLLYETLRQRSVS